MGKKLREILLEAKKKDAKNGKKKNGNGKDKKNGKMLNKLHALDDQIEEFIDGLEDEIMGVEDNPMFQKKANQLLADMSKEYSEFIMALRSIVNAVDRKEKVLPAFEKQQSRVRDIMDGAGGNGAPPEEEPPPPEEEAPEEGDEEFVIAKKDKKSPVKEALEMTENLEKNKLFILGRQVNNAFDHEIALKPKKSDFSKVSKKLGITAKMAEKAWNIYTWG